MNYRRDEGLRKGNRKRKLIHHMSLPNPTWDQALCGTWRGDIRSENRFLAYERLEIPTYQGSHKDVYENTKPEKAGD